MLASNPNNYLLYSDKGDVCTTPNGEVAKCLSIYECPIILKAVLSKTVQAAEFAQKSNCGKIGSLPLVCCGSSAEYTTIGKTYLSTNMFTTSKSYFAIPCF